MTDSKKYYWLKLKTDFFNQREIKKLRKIAGGDTFTIIYLKMQLLSIKNDGIITFEMTEAHLDEQLALELDEELENVRMTIAFLNANALIEPITDFDYMLSKVPELIGSESTSAERVRRLRAKQSTNAPLQCNANVTTCNTEIELEKELDIDKELYKDNASSKNDSFPVKKNIGYSDSSFERKATDYLINTMLKEDAKARVPKTPIEIYKWCDHIEKLIRIDERTETEIETVLKFARNDGFWKGNILSTKKFREKFPQLLAQMNKGTNTYKGNRQDQVQSAAKTYMKMLDEEDDDDCKQEPEEGYIIID